jgi:hypothetical protein
MSKKPTSKDHSESTARDVFSYLLMTSMLIAGVIAFLTLVFQYVNVQLPDTLDYWPQGYLNSMRGAIATLVVVWPVHNLMSWLINSDAKKDSAKQNIWVRKWLIHLTLFISAIAVIVDLVTLVGTFLDGELSTRFLIKVASVLIVAGCVFAYYLWELRRDINEKTNTPKVAAIVSALVILVTIISSFFVIGTPAQQRQVRLDAERVDDLSGMERSVLYYWTSNEELPDSIEALEEEPGIYLDKDPETNESYEYSATGETTFQLCATFATEPTDIEQKSSRTRAVDFSQPGLTGENWDHGIGHVCFDRSINPDQLTKEILR